jgi:hypothetical protein
MASMMNFAVVGYLDPGTGSLVVQALVGGFAGLFVLGKYLWQSVLASRSGKSRESGG